MYVKAHHDIALSPVVLDFIPPPVGILAVCFSCGFSISNVANISCMFKGGVDCRSWSENIHFATALGTSELDIREKLFLTNPRYIPIKNVRTPR